MQKKTETLDAKLAWGGLAAAFAAIFLPAAHGPLGMSVALIDGTDGLVALALAAICTAAIATAHSALVAVCGGGFVAVALVKIFAVLGAKAQAMADLDQKLAGNPFRGMADLAVHSLRPGFGMFVMLAGGACIIAAYFRARRSG